MWMPKAPQEEGTAPLKPLEQSLPGIALPTTRRVPSQSTDPFKAQVGGDHYKTLGIQPVEAMKMLLTREEYIGFLKGQIIKYSIRQGRKAGSDDAGKALHFGDMLSKEIAEKT